MSSWFRMRSFFHILWCFSTLFLRLLLPSLALNVDGTLLLSFKYSILNDPLSVLDNWNYDDETPCLWTGVTCAQVETPFGTPAMFRVISLVLPNSKLLGSIPEDLGYIQHLRTLDLSGNFLNGTLPNSLFNASELQVLSLSSNAITGGLPGFSGGGLKNLKLLNLSDNALAGNLPPNLPSLQELTVVSLKRNFFSGTIPNGFLYVEVLDLSSNLLTGSLPLEFGGERLRYLNLSTNKLSGPVSPEFAKKIPANASINLSFNNLTGEIPESMALSNQQTESFRGNMDLCGKPLKKLCTVPSSLSAPPNISTTNSSAPAIAAIPQTIDSTPLPSSPGAAANAAQNQGQHRLKPGTIAGIAIGDLAGIGVLAIICLYVYQLRKRRADEGSKEIPLPVAVDKQQKDNVKDSQLSTAKETTSRSLPSWSCLTIRNGEETSEATASDCDDENKNMDIGHQIDQYHEKERSTKYKSERSLVMVDGETELDIETLLKASAYILGSSAAASIVYKAVLEDGSAFAVRRIGESGFERFKDFESQVKAIAKLRHPNLVLLRGFYWGDDEKLVIYDYISNGSLANAGYRKVGSSPYHMPFQVRLKVAKGVARGLAYVHEKRHVHGNIKPSNILLTPEMEPIISDFGLHSLLHGKNSYKTDAFSSRHFGSMRSSTSTATAATSSSRDGLHDHSINGSPCIAPAGFMGCTSPYHAPESLNNLKPNPKWDVYSFGILLLELLTGKVFSDRELGQWTAGLLMEDKNRVLRLADVAIRGDVANREDAMLECFKLGFSCASLNPQKRPSMKDALQVLDRIQTSPSY
ncbi:probable LRR receptor-like serine/threonine-protein kinase At4g37250 [Coffea arabica]|uniref:Probable LRR receptor-like serine/threonine-protein kinase At4g37250 n=1 Tax=Coffea arabica TaxID=13443 RepID=A0A6P6WD52_COFAR